MERINSETPDDRPSISILHALIRLLLDPDFLAEDIVATELMEDKNTDGESGSCYRLTRTMQLQETRAHFLPQLRASQQASAPLSPSAKDYGLIVHMSLLAAAEHLDAIVGYLQPGRPLPVPALNTSVHNFTALSPILSVPLLPDGNAA
ncbi:hypothetical protein O988_00779 [Pseudogymnoascus sp. VKM F-3808]|nr:hypothetical protein O988_00779 [Pseudogymnoascus sp. VKM F-3808]